MMSSLLSNVKVSNPPAYPVASMSRAFVKEDADGGPKKDYHLPPRDDPGFDRAAARVLVEAARAGETAAAEDATGYRWGERRLAPWIREALLEATATGDERMEQLARRFCRDSQARALLGQTGQDW